MYFFFFLPLGPGIDFFVSLFVVFGSLWTTTSDPLGVYTYTQQTNSSKRARAELCSGGKHLLYYRTSLWWQLFVCLWFPSGSFTRTTRCHLFLSSSSRQLFRIYWNFSLRSASLPRPTHRGRTKNSTVVFDDCCKSNKSIASLKWGRYFLKLRLPAVFNRKCCDACVIFRGSGSSRNASGCSPLLCCRVTPIDHIPNPRSVSRGCDAFYGKTDDCRASSSKNWLRDNLTVTALYTTTAKWNDFGFSCIFRAGFYLFSEAFFPSYLLFESPAAKGGYTTCPRAVILFLSKIEKQLCCKRECIPYRKRRRRLILFDWAQQPISSRFLQVLNDVACLLSYSLCLRVKIS